MDLVEVNGKEVLCDTALIARKFGMQHAKVVNSMETLIPKLDDFRVTGFHPKFLIEDREYRGKKYKAYLLNRDCFTILAMRFDTKLARRWQGQFISAFNAMESLILKAENNNDNPLWLQNRQASIIARREETDVIRVFVEYATEQGSTKAKFYYKHVTNACYSALDMMVHRKPKLRDTMDGLELAQLLLMETYAKNQIQKYMDLGRDYKDIYTSVKNDLIEYGNALSLPTLTN